MSNVYQRIQAVLREGKAIEKTGQMSGPSGNYAFHETDEVLAFLRPLLAKHGIIFVYSVQSHAMDLKTIEGARGTRSERETIKAVLCRLINVDDPTDYLEGLEYGYGLDSQDKGPGKATSYAIKTWLLNVFMLRGQPDEDQFDTYDGYIGGDQVDEIQKLILQSGADEQKILKLAGADCVGHIKLSQVGIVRDLLKKKAEQQKAKK